MLKGGKLSLFQLWWVSVGWLLRIIELGWGCEPISAEACSSSITQASQPAVSDAAAAARAAIAEARRVSPLVLGEGLGDAVAKAVIVAASGAAGPPGHPTAPPWPGRASTGRRRSWASPRAASAWGSKGPGRRARAAPRGTCAGTPRDSAASSAARPERAVRRPSPTPAPPGPGPRGTCPGSWRRGGRGSAWSFGSGILQADFLCCSSLL